MPKAKSPEWFPHQIDLRRGQEIVSVDDDQSIHQLWKDRLYKIDHFQSNISYRSFTSPQMFIDWRSSQEKDLKNKIVFLIDYEMLRYGGTGRRILNGQSLTTIKQFPQPTFFDVAI